MRGYSCNNELFPADSHFGIVMRLNQVDPQHAVPELEEKVRQLSSLLEVNRVINADLDPARVITTILEQAVGVLGAERGTLWLLEENNTVIISKANIGPGAETIGEIKLQPGEGIAGRVIETGRGELVADAQKDPRWSSRVDKATGLKTRSIIAAPLRGQNGVIGCLQLINKTPEAGLSCEEGSPLFDEGDLKLLMALGTQATLVIENSRLLEATRAFARDLEKAWRSTLDALAAAMETRDNDTRAHCYRTVELSVLLAKRMGLPEDELSSLARGALLHDIGKIGIPDMILLKPGKLSDEERQIMNQHVKLGHDMLEHIDFFQNAMPIVLYHHENYDGSGYLSGIKGEEIPLAARIFHVVDCYDALTSERPYKQPWSHEKALAELKSQAGHHFDPRVIAILETITPEEAAYIRHIQDFSAETQSLIGRA
jgi:putative nucleotidyltransferase with HDIG domain